MLPTLLLAAITASPMPSIPTADASRIFERARTLCRTDDGKLWGVSLCVPMMIGDPNTYQAVTNTATKDSTPDGDLFRVTLPKSVLVSNAPTEFNGMQWAQLMLPMPDGDDIRDVMLMHESFHIVQAKLGFTGYSGTSSISGDPFLDTQAGRIWLRGEFHALRTALKSSGNARIRAVADAIALRLYRNSLSSEGAEIERQQDIMEGLAEGTGVDAGLPPSHRIPYALNNIAMLEDQPSYARAFAYATGPAYCELLDGAALGWRRNGVTLSSDIVRMTMHAYHLRVDTPNAAGAQAIIARYDGAAIQSQEAARAARKAELAVRYTRELVTGPTIALPMKGFKIKFNPRDIETFDPHGSVYHTLTVTAPWGELTVSGGDALIAKDFSVLRIAAPPAVSGNVLKGDGWTLTLAGGHDVVPDPQNKGSFIAH